jgi:hypothetical protein
MCSTLAPTEGVSLPLGRSGRVCQFSPEQAKIGLQGITPGLFALMIANRESLGAISWRSPALRLSRMDLFFNDQTNAWFWQPLVGAIMGIIVGEIFKRIVGPPHEQSSPAEFSETRVPFIRTEISPKAEAPSKSFDGFLSVVLVLTLFYIPNRPLYLTVFTFVVWLSWGFALVMCLWLTRTRQWSSQPYEWVISGLVIGAIFLAIGGAFAQSPPERQVPLADDFLNYGMKAFSSSVPRDLVFLEGLLWIALHFFGILALVFVAKDMLFLGLGTVALVYGKGWLIKLTLREISKPRLAVIYIVIAGICGVLLVGGWGFDFITWIRKIQSGG